MDFYDADDLVRGVGMTTIAWDGKTLAADQCSTSGYVQSRVHKLYKGKWHDGQNVLIGFCGSGEFAHAIRLWLAGDLIERPKFGDYDVNKGDAVGLLIDESLNIFKITANLHLLPFNENVYAMGAGAECAFGAMEAGASAELAVRIAARRTAGTGFDVDTVSWVETPRPGTPEWVSPAPINPPVIDGVHAPGGVNPDDPKYAHRFPLKT